MTDSNLKNLAHQATTLAKEWLEHANQLMSAEEKALQRQLQRLLNHPKDKLALTQLIDRSFRSQNLKQVASQVTTILRRYGVPHFFSAKDKLLTYAFLTAGRHIPGISVPKIISKIRQDSQKLVLSAEPEALLAHLDQRRSEGITVNINHIGEAVMGEDEAIKRLDTYLNDLTKPQIENISIKITTIYSQIHPLAFDHALEILVKRLTLLYRAAKDHLTSSVNGDKTFKLVNLDMEEYRDLYLTVAAFQKTLNLEEFKNYTAGIVLQAYLPEAFEIQQKLTQWARKRVASGGAPIRLRIVKGANLEMEQVESALTGWPLAPFDNKRDVDANYKQMMFYGMQPENMAAVRMAVASHNLFDLALAQKLAEANKVTDLFRFEMLEGMADHICRALRESSANILLYAPMALPDDFVNAIAYLIRRLDENTAPENFLRHAPGLTPDSANWNRLKEQFLATVDRVDQIKIMPHRNQNRTNETFAPMGTYHQKEFRNEPDTDWSLSANRTWAESIRARWKKSDSDPALEIPLVVAGTDIFSQRKTQAIYDPSQYPHKVCLAQFALADETDLNAALTTAKADEDGWRRLDTSRRHEILSKVAAGLRRARGDLIGAAVAGTGKIFTEVDVEVSEAVDFAEYYPYSALKFTGIANLDVRGKGVGVVISPWNFPVAIPCGGIVAALSAGNTVIFKPSSNAVLPAWILCNIFWDAGVSRRTLQFLPFIGRQLGDRLVNSDTADFCILTGGTETGMAMLAKKPDLFLCAETGGKNATIVTAAADRDQAIKNVVYSAFGNCGQKCSATSLLILEKEVYEDEHFKRQLVDAARSLAVGSAWNFENKLGPLIQPPQNDLKRALTQLEPQEQWALKPINMEENPNLWTPGIKWGVVRGSYTHKTEFFGPMLAVMRARDLDDAVSIANDTGYGLTAGIESLDPEEIETFKRKLKAGNLYINRGTTGAITLRQPFGGMGKSALGPGIKAGSPNYVTQFMAFKEVAHPTVEKLDHNHSFLQLAQKWQTKAVWGVYGELQKDIEKSIRALKSYLYHVQREFKCENDYFHLRGQDNILRYLPMSMIAVRIDQRDSLFEMLARIIAVRLSGSALLVSLPKEAQHPAACLLYENDFKPLIQGAMVLNQSDDDLIKFIPKLERIRYAAPDRAPLKVLAEAAKTGFYVAREPVLMEGRLEMLHYFTNQSICNNYHRYGNISQRIFELNMSL